MMNRNVLIVEDRGTAARCSDEESRTRRHCGVPGGGPPVTAVPFQAGASTAISGRLA